MHVHAVSVRRRCGNGAATARLMRVNHSYTQTCGPAPMRIRRRLHEALPKMNGNESTTQESIDSIDLYDSMLDGDRKPLIDFVLKTRLSSNAKMRLNPIYIDVKSLLSDMRTHLLTRKSDTALQSRLQNVSQGNKSNKAFADEIEQLFVDLTISQTNGNEEAYKILRPINEKNAKKRFADGLQSQRLSTVISARFFSSLKDAIRLCLIIVGLFLTAVEMCDEYEVFEYLEREYRMELRNKHRRTRQMNDPFDLEDSDFIKEYRLSPDLIRNLCDELEPILKTNPRRSNDLSIETKVLTAVYLYAHGSYQKPTGNAQNVAQQTVSAVLAEVTAAINNIIIRNKYIKFPQTPAQRNANKLRFYNKFGFPGVIGCIDGTHVAIVRPNEHEDRYYCRKNYHSLNVQLICNADMDIISVDASHPGSNHDSFIWNNHPLKIHLNNLSTTEALWLLGDSGYPLRKTMMTPILDAEPNSPEAYYTECHVQTRNVIERTIGVLKARFRCLLVHRTLHYQPQMAGFFTNACVILHNICNAAKNT
ncbi:hypothetical protein evm_014081 [Chilo suppressalis]|nr:hypothetical protein evm_014081 [Chilo suppressalis]